MCSVLMSGVASPCFEREHPKHLDLLKIFPAHKSPDTGGLGAVRAHCDMGLGPSPMILHTLPFAPCQLSSQALVLPKLRGELTGQKPQKPYRKISLKVTRPKDNTNDHVPPWFRRLRSIITLCIGKNKVTYQTFLPSSGPKAHATILWYTHAQSTL